MKAVYSHNEDNKQCGLRDYINVWWGTNNEGATGTLYYDAGAAFQMHWWSTADQMMRRSVQQSESKSHFLPPTMHWIPANTFKWAFLTLNLTLSHSVDWTSWVKCQTRVVRSKCVIVPPLSTQQPATTNTNTDAGTRRGETAALHRMRCHGDWNSP